MSDPAGTEPTPDPRNTGRPDPPEGFIPYQRTGPYLELIGPLYESADGPLVVALWLDERHTNTRGFVHAGLLVALADTVLGHAILREAPSTPIVTASLTTDFVGSAHPGAWLEGGAEVRRRGKRVAFANASFRAQGQLVMTASGIFVVRTFRTETPDIVDG